MRQEKWEELFALAEGQHGAFSARQADELGVDSKARARAQRDGLIDRVRPGVWVVKALLGDWTVMAGIQLQQPRAVAGYRAGGLLHRFDGVEEIAMDVLVPRDVRLRGPHVHRVADLVVPEIVLIDGLRVTDIVRTAIDYASLVDDEHVERALEAIFRRHPEARALLVERATALKRRGKAGPPRILRVIARMPETPTGSDLETVYWQGLVRFGVPLPQRQVAFGQYFFDMALEPELLFVELDGYASHSERGAFITDRHRQNAAVARGWAPLRFSDSDVRHHMRRTAMQTLAVLERRRLELVARRGA